MKQLLPAFLFLCCGLTARAQKTELYDLLKKIIPDSTGYENVGDWAVGKPKLFPIRWKEDRLIMSEDTSINFYRLGTADMSIMGKTFMQAGKPISWNVMLKGARSGYSSFAIISSPSKDLSPHLKIDSLLANKHYTAKLIKSCDNKDLAGYYYYEVKLPKEDTWYIKFSWISVNGNTALRIDGYDSWSKYAVKLACPN